MSILFFTKGDRTIASSRQRVWLLAEHLSQQYGYTYEVLHTLKYPFWSLSKKRFQIIRLVWSKLCKPYDVVFVHKALYPFDIFVLFWFARRFLKKRFVFDLDDAEWIHSSFKSKFLTKISDIVFCGSHPILEWVKTQTQHVKLVPTVIDADIYAAYAVHHEEREVYTIVWSGLGRAHFQDGHFTMIKPGLDEAYKKNKFRFVILGSQNYQPLKKFFDDSAYEVVFEDSLDWGSPKSVPEKIFQYKADIGLMPTSNTFFNRAKCAFKAIDYMGCGVPTIASAVGEANIVIEDGVTGILIHDDKEWGSAITKLLHDVNLRKKMGESSLEVIEKKYSYKAIAPEIEKSLQSIVK